MAQGPPDQPPESVILGAFAGIKNVVTPERLTGSDLERATNIDLDDVGQPRRRRGQTRKDLSSWHSVRDIAGKAYGVRDGVLGIIRTNYSFSTLGVTVGDSAVCYTAVGDDVFFSSAAGSGKIGADEQVSAWGQTGGQGQWLSPVLQPTETLGEISGRLLGDPPIASSIEAYKGRIYLAAGRTLWVTVLYLYDIVDRTRNFIQFEHDITLLAAAGDGLYVGTTGGLYFLQGTFETFKLGIVVSDAVLPGSVVQAPADLIHPQARNGPVPTSDASLMMTVGGILACFDGGSAYNLTQDRVIFPTGVSAAGLFRQDQGANSYVAAVDSAGGPAANTRIGDYVDAEIVRFGGA